MDGKSPVLNRGASLGADEKQKDKKMAATSEGFFNFHAGTEAEKDRLAAISNPVLRE